MTIQFHFITDVATPQAQALFDRVFALYETQFPANERHTRDALLLTLRADRGAVWVAATDDTGQVLGGAGAFVSEGAGDIGRLVTIAYLFVSPAARGKRLGARIESALVDHVGASSLLLVCDIEDPGRMLESGMTRAEYDESVRIAGITPFQRLSFWRDHLGYRATDFLYVLKVNRPDVEPTTILKLHAKHIKDGQLQILKTVSAKLLRDAAAFINTQTPFDKLPDDYRTHPALTPMWAWADENPVCDVAPHSTDEYKNLEKTFAEKLK
jgi:GNAT superfamily N-acetyltransferase